MDPTLLQFFFNKHSTSAVSPSAPSSLPPTSPIPETTATTTTTATTATTATRRPKLLLFTALLPFMQLHKRRTGLKSREAILAALALRDASLFDFIAHQTTFCRKLAEGLGAAYIALPSTLEARGAQDKQSDAIQAEFVNRLQFCNAVMMACASDSSGSILAEYLCRDLLRWFLKPCLFPALSSVNESAQVAAMSYTSMMIEVLHETAPKSPMIALVTRFILGLRVDREMMDDDNNDDNGKKQLDEDKKNDAEAIIDNGNVLRTHLIRRLNSQVPSVSYASLELFNSLLEVHDSHVLINLILRNVELNDATKKATLNVFTASAAPIAPSVPQVSQVKQSDSMMMTPLKRKSLQGSLLSPTAIFLDGFPGSPKPKPGTATRPLVFEDYLTDAHTQSVARMAGMAVYWSDTMLSSTGTPKRRKNSEVGDNNIPLDDDDSVQIHEEKKDKETEKDEDVKKQGTNNTEKKEGGTAYVEGTFMCALYDKLEGMLDESLDENLVLTEIFAKLAQCPDQRVQGLLIWEQDMNETSQKNDGDKARRSLVTVLKTVWLEAQERVDEVDNFEEAIEAHRLRLGTILEGRNKDSDGGSSRRNVGSGIKAQSTFCEGYIVLEEFVKEISAIIQARGELDVLYRRLL
jgi:hypothetical protein